MKIHADKIETIPPHALHLQDVRRILKTVPPDWIAGLKEVRLANSLEHNSPYAFFNRYDSSFTIYSRRGTKKQALVAILSALAAGALNIRIHFRHRVSEADKHRLGQLIQPLVDELLPQMTPRKKLSPEAPMPWRPVPFPNDPVSSLVDMTILLRVSAKFHRQFPCRIDKGDAPVRPFPQTWNLDLLSHGRSQLLILASEEHSLFSVLIPTGHSRNLESFTTPFRERLVELFAYFGLWDRRDANPFVFSGRTDRRIIGSQNDLVFLSRRFLESAEKPASPGTLGKMEAVLNSTPMSYLGMRSPLEALWKKPG